MEKLIIRKNDLVDEIYDILPDQTKGSIKTVVDALCEVLKDDLSKGHTISLYEIGRFVSHGYEGTLYNMHTGKHEKKVYHRINFKPSTYLRNLMGENYSYEITKKD